MAITFIGGGSQSTWRQSGVPLTTTWKLNSPV